MPTTTLSQPILGTPDQDESPPRLTDAEIDIELQHGRITEAEATELRSHTPVSLVAFLFNPRSLPQALLTLHVCGSLPLSVGHAFLFHSVDNLTSK